MCLSMCVCVSVCVCVCVSVCVCVCGQVGMYLTKLVALVAGPPRAGDGQEVLR